MTTCGRCKREWTNDTEQAASIRIYGWCIVCCVEKEHTENYSWNINKVQEELAHFISQTEINS